MDLVRRGYLALLSAGLRRPGVTVLVALLAFGGGAVSIRSRGMEVLPKMDGGSFFVSLQTPSGSSLEETERVVREVEALLGAQPEVVLVQSQVGFEQGMRSLGQSGVQGPTQGFITVTLTPRTERSTSLWEVQQRVRDGMAKIPAIRSASVRELGNTAKSTTSAPVVVLLQGPDAAVLDALGTRALELLATVEGVVEPTRSWELDQVRARVSVDAPRAAQLGLTPAKVAQLMLAGSEGMAAGELHDGLGPPLPLRVRCASPESPGPAELLAYPVWVPGATSALPLRAVARIEEAVGAGLITRENQATTLEVSACTRGRALSFILKDVERALTALELPRGYGVQLAGEQRDLLEARGELGRALGIAMLAVYLLLVAQFRSFLHPLTVMLSVPLSLSGVGAALALAGKPVSMPVMVGFILLVGTVVNNAILLVDFVQRAREEGTARRQALLDAVATRFRPIMMTSLSTIIGMVPLAAEWALGAERFSPLATAVIGGMASATLLTLVVIPVLYELFDELGERLRPATADAPGEGLAGARGGGGSAPGELGALSRSLQSAPGSSTVAEDG